MTGNRIVFNTMRWVCIPLVIIFPFCSYAQPVKNIVVGENTRIKLAKDYNYTFENMVAVDPQDPDHLTGAILTMCPDTVKNCANTLIDSRDGGRHWQSESIPWGANPWCSILPNGVNIVSYIYGSNYLLGSKKSQLSDNVTRRKTWNSELVFGSGFDHSMLITDMSSGPYHGHVYLIATQSLQAGDQDPFVLIARSENGGRNFDFRNNFYPFRNVDINAKTPVIFNDGTLAIPIIIRGRYLPGENKSVSFEETTNWLVTSKDGGATFSPPRFITSNAGNGYHALAIGKVQGSVDRLYYVYGSSIPKGIYVTHSDDRGESWTRPLRVDGRSVDTHYIIVGNVTVNKDGYVGIIYIKREDANDQELYNIYFTVSWDGGASFARPTKVNSKSSSPNRNQGWFVNSWPQGGDYCGLVARPDGSFLAIWSDARDGSFKLYQSFISFE